MLRLSVSSRLAVGLFAAAATFAGYQYFWATRTLAQTTTANTAVTIMIPWFTGSDSGYTSLLSIANTSMDPYGTPATTAACYAWMEPAAGGAIQGGTIGNFSPGTITVMTQAQVSAATGVTLADSSVRATLYLTCSGPYVHAQWLLVNPGGPVEFLPGLVLPQTRQTGNLPEQLLP
jgi:hypothetical protein